MCVSGAEVLEGGDLQGGAIGTKAGVLDYYGEQVATEDEAEKRWQMASVMESSKH